MRTFHRKPTNLFVGLTGFIIIFIYILIVPPDTTFNILLFLFLLLVSGFYLFVYVFNSLSRGAAYAFLLTFYIALRILNFKNIFVFVFVSLIIGGGEWYFKKRRTRLPLVKKQSH